MADILLCLGSSLLIGRFCRDAQAHALARTFAFDSLATSTKASYLSSWTKFRAICAQLAITSPLPISSKDFAAVISFYAAKERKLPSTLTMISAVSFAHTLNGFPSPSQDPTFSLVLRGIKRKTFVPPKRAVPLSSSDVSLLVLRLIASDLEVDSFFDVCLSDWRTAAQAVLSFFALARFDCLTKLRPVHLRFQDRLVLVTFPSSKTDQLGEGRVVSVHRANDAAFCPVDFLEKYLRRLNWEFQLEFPSKNYEGPIFPSLTVRKIKSAFGDAVSSLPTAPVPFSHSGATMALRKALAKVGHPQANLFTMHSGRRGGASAAVAAGCDLLTLKRQGRWKSDACPQLYVDEHVSINTDFTKYLAI